MEPNPLAGIIIIFVSGIVNASFPLPMKYARAWKWENLWFVFSLLALLVLPVGAATWAIPDLPEVYTSLPTRDLLPGAVFGLLWGFAQTSFGIAVPHGRHGNGLRNRGWDGCSAGQSHPDDGISPRGPV